MSAPTRPVLRYHGGKWLLAPWIVSHFPAHDVYVEPFGGAASVLMRKPRAKIEYYNDRDDEVVNLFRVLRDDGERLESLLRLTPFSRTEFFASYEHTDDPVERARRCVVRAQQGFGTSALVRKKTGWRSWSNRNSKHGYASDWIAHHEAIASFVERLQGVHIENAPAVDLMRRVDGDGVLFYCDPPYVHETRGIVSASNGYRHEMSDEDHTHLADVLHGLRGAVVLSGYHSDLYDRLYADWPRREREARIQDNAGADTRVEVLWLNSTAAAAAQPDMFAQLARSYLADTEFDSPLPDTTTQASDVERGVDEMSSQENRKDDGNVCA